MKTLRRVEVEPLSEQRWAKIERSVFTSLKGETEKPRDVPVVRRRSLGFRFGLVAAAVALLCVSALVVIRLGGTPVVSPPSRIITGASASHLTLPGVSLDVDPQSAVVVDGEPGRALLVVLDRGSIVCEVAPRSHDAPLIVQAGAMRVRVVGTRFTVTRIGDSAQIAVSHGAVEVSILGQTRRVQAGEVWPPAAAPRLSVSQPEANPSEPGPEASVSALPKTPAPVANARLRSAQRRANTAEHAAPSAAEQPEAAEVTRSRQSVFEEAAALERSDPTRASELYRSLEAGGDSWSQNALYARGRLAASRGNAAGARALLALYLQRFPRGSNAEDARAVLQRLR
jgi:transmembrane sensor